GRPGALIVGSNPFTVRLAQSLEKVKVPVIIVDSSWKRLRMAREAGVPFYHGDMLSEQTEYNLDTIPYDYMLAISDNHSYNSLVCTTFIPEYDRMNVFKISQYDPYAVSPDDTVSQVGGRVLFDTHITLEDLNQKLHEGYVFRQTRITDQFPYQQYLKEKDDSTVFLYWLKPSGEIRFYSNQMRMTPTSGDLVVSLTPPIKDKEKIQSKLENQRNGKNNGNDEKKHSKQEYSQLLALLFLYIKTESFVMFKGMLKVNVYRMSSANFNFLFNAYIMGMPRAMTTISPAAVVSHPNKNGIFKARFSSKAMINMLNVKTRVFKMSSTHIFLMNRANKIVIPNESTE